MKLRVVKRNGRVTPFDGGKIESAILKAMRHGSNIVKPEVAEDIARDIENIIKKTKTLTIYQIEDMVYHNLIERGEIETAKAYEGYRAIQEYKREVNTTDNSILGLLDFTNDEVMRENSNKNGRIISTQRDLIAGEVSKDIAKRKLIPPHLIQAHNDGLIHIHDMDYIMQPMFNCFSGDTRFVTDSGVRAFNEMYSGDKVNVLDKNGEWQEATVKKYDKGKLQTITLTSGRTTKKIRASYDHRWILKDGTVTTNLEVGDRLALLPRTETNEIIPELFCVGFIIGDGNDYKTGNSEGVAIRLCEDQVQYADMFKQSGYLQSTYDYQNGDIKFTKNGFAFKQKFLDSKAWKFLNRQQKYSIMQGYISADGCRDRNMFYTSDERVVDMLTDISVVAGCHIIQVKKTIRDTNYKKGAVLYEVSYRVEQQDQNNWIIKDINREDLHQYDLWCVEEPKTESFTLDGGIVTGNCCLINLQDMLEHGTVINGKLVETPQSFQVACTVTTQVVAQVASNQYGGQSLNKIDTVLAPYARKSYEKYYRRHLERLSKITDTKMQQVQLAKQYADEDMRKEIRDGVQTIQYQINTLMTTNGQAPFLTLLLYFEPDYEYAYEASIIQEEILKQRIEGIKNEKGVWITPAFPKLIYVLDEHNIHEDSEYYYLTKLSAECSAKRMYPDYISAKKMREMYEGNILAPMGCRSFLSPWKDSNGEYKFDGRFNFGVQTLNLPNIALSSGGDMDLFWQIFDSRMDLIKEMALVRYNLLKDITTEVSPVHWEHGAITRLNKGDKIGHLLKGGYATVSIGYIGVYETVKYMLGVSHTDKAGHDFALEIMDKLNEYKDKWKEETGLGFAVYGTPSENTAGRLCALDRETFGDVEDITDKGYYINSYHVDVREEIDAFSKLSFEAEFQNKTIGGAISYIEIPNLQHNVEAILEVMKFMYDNILYAEFNTKLDYCHVCGFKGEIIINDDLEWECPQCHNKNEDKMNVVRRTCGYLGENFFSEGRTRDIKDRVLHL